jgi:hypothetical protein
LEGGLQFSTASNNGSNVLTLAERMRIDSSGNVGIGTASPSYKLDVASGDTTAGIGYAIRIRANATALAGSLQFTDAAVTTQNGAIAVDTSANMKFYTIASERMRIDSSGRVTMPYQPAFAASRDAGDVAPQAVFIGNRVLTNRGGHYSPSTGRFTAPVSGAYLFSMYVMGTATGPEQPVSLQFRKNGAPLSSSQDPYTRTSSGATYCGISGSTIIELAAGDYVDTKNNGTTVFYAVGTGHNGFSGYLIG